MQAAASLGNVEIVRIFLSDGAFPEREDPGLDGYALDIALLVEARFRWLRSRRQGYEDAWGDLLDDSGHFGESDKPGV